MKLIKIIMLAVIVVIVAVSCQQKSSSHSAIELNNGQKWSVNAEMKPYIEDAEVILKNYSDDNYEALADQLEAKNKSLVKSCTMSGKSHDELHKWLHPHMELIEQLEEADNKIEADKIIEKLKSSFVKYHQYFQ